MPCGLALDKAINRSVQVLKIYLLSSESDDVLHIAYNIRAGGTCFDHRELRRHDEVYLDALGAARIPDPTTAGDFCRWFTPVTVRQLMEALRTQLNRPAPRA
jgi:hypothetical protein